jgi:hypothetical protein
MRRQWTGHEGSGFARATCAGENIIPQCEGKHAGKSYSRFVAAKAGSTQRVMHPKMTMPARTPHRVQARAVPL